MRLQPIHAGEQYQLYCGDSLDVLASMEPESIDMIFADPPYRLSNGGSTVSSGRRVPVHKGDWDVSEGVAGDFAFHRQWIEACRRVLKADGTIWISGTYHSIFACGLALQMSGFRILNDVVWYKPNASPNLGRRMFTASHETLIWASKSPKSRHVFNYDKMRAGDFPEDKLKSPGRQMRSVWSLTGLRPEEKRFGKHPTQKPERLLERIMSASTLEGQVVLDPFCGSGTTGVAALRLGRSFIGIDLNAMYLSTIAQPRLNSVSR